MRFNPCPQGLTPSESHCRSLIWEKGAYGFVGKLTWASQAPFALTPRSAVPFANRARRHVHRKRPHQTPLTKREDSAMIDPGESLLAVFPCYTTRIPGRSSVRASGEFMLAPHRSCGRIVNLESYLAQGATN